MNKIKLCGIAFGGVLIVPSAALAEDPIVELGAVEVVSAMRSDVAVDDTPRSVSVVDARTISERPAAAGVQALLTEVPGIHFARTGGLGGQIVMRGFNSNSMRSIITVDGDRYRGRSTLEFNMFDPNGIERIEVIRGPASALYGADAMNGVVNIVTRRARVDREQPFSLTPRLRAVEWSSVNDMFGARVELAGGGQGFDVMIGAHSRTADDYRTPRGDAENSDYRMRGVDFNIGFSPTTESRWELSGRYQSVDTGRAGGLGAAPGAPLMEVSERPIIERYLRAGYEGRNFGALADRIDASLYVRQFETDIYAYNRSNAAVTAHVHTRVYTPTVWGGHLIAMKAVGDHLLSYGADFFNEDFAGRNVRTVRTNSSTGATISDTGWVHADRRSEQTNIGMFVSDDWQLNERWNLSGALRADVVRVKIGGALPQESAAQTAAFGDDPGNTDTALTGSLGAVYKVDPVWSLVANLSRGFRAPSGTELTITSTAGTITTLPSPDLEPEYSNTVELGARWNAASHRGSVTMYRSEYSDLITTAVIDPTLRQRRNVSEASISGLELEGVSSIGRQWRVAYTLTATRGTDKASGNPLPGIAPLAARLALRYTEPQWYVEGAARGFKGKTRIDPTQEREGRSYAIFDLYAGVQLDHWMGERWRGWKLVAGVENIFDREGRNPAVGESLAYPWGLIGNPLLEPGRGVAIKLSSEF